MTRMSARSGSGLSGLRAGRPERRARATRRRRNRGTVLIVTMWILVVLAGMVLVLAASIRIEGACSANHAAKQQAAAIENGAVQYVLASLDSLGGEIPSEANTPCQGVQIGNGAFWILRPDYDDGREEVYGVVDEASKLNLNTATLEMLSVLPRMTPEIAAAIVDWRDIDSDLTVGGAESEYYLLLPDPYECKNAPLETVEELLLIKLTSRELLLGEDTNRSGRLDDNENDADETDPPDNRNGQLDAGLADLVTVYSSETNTTASGSRRTDVNRASTRDLSNVLRRSVSQERLGEVVNRARLGRPFQNILDFYYRTGLTMEEFEPVADQLTTSEERTLRGLINVNTAPKQVLLCLPGLEESDVSALMSGRSADNLRRNSIAWVADALPQEKALGIGAYLTARSYQFSADIVSVAGSGRAFRRCRIVVDARSSPPRVVYRQDLTPLGWPLAPEWLAALRAGTPLEDVLEVVYREAR
jgi:type II secretory pathway component PulK